MKKALLRLEDVGPGGYYESAENQAKLMVVADYLQAAGVPFQVAVIPRFVDPGKGIDRSIAVPSDLVSARFINLLHRFILRGASLGMHGYTHQYGLSISGGGFEFAYEGCTEDCPPDDPPSSLNNLQTIRRSYAYSRFYGSLTSFLTAGFRPDWFETPHYAASDIGRRILDASNNVMHEANPDAPDSRRVTARPSRSAWGKTLYVPTPLGFVGGERVEDDVNRIIREAESYAEHDLASFFYHPFLEFSYIRLAKNSVLLYDPRSPLHRLIRAFQLMGRRFVSIRDVIVTPPE